MDTTEVIFNLAWVGAVIGFFLPLLISFVKRAQMSRAVKRTIAVVASIIAGVVNTGVQAGWTFASTAEFAQLATFAVIDVYVVASVVYRNFWDGTAIDTNLEAVGS